MFVGLDRSRRRAKVRTRITIGIQDGSDNHRWGRGLGWIVGATRLSNTSAAANYSASRALPVKFNTTITG